MCLRSDDRTKVVLCEPGRDTPASLRNRFLLEFSGPAVAQRLSKGPFGDVSANPWTGSTYSIDQRGAPSRSPGRSAGGGKELTQRAVSGRVGGRQPAHVTTRIKHLAGTKESQQIELLPTNDKKKWTQP
uniref:AP-2 complex subunit mu-B isoform X3 n=1 Tax=Monopterus albus TaxID=43700 RepID=UPI0009B353EA|nr:uncharacterized protein LOC109972725 isoform X3 [Monopterus albus]